MSISLMHVAEPFVCVGLTMGQVCVIKVKLKLLNVFKKTIEGEKLTIREGREKERKSTKT